MGSNEQITVTAAPGEYYAVVVDFAGAATVGMGQGPHSHDLIGMPDLATYTLVPWEHGVARFACDIEVDGAPWAYCSRTAHWVRHSGSSGSRVPTPAGCSQALVTRS